MPSRSEGRAATAPSLVARVPWWARVVIVYGLARVVTTVLLLVFAALQTGNAWTGPHPGYADFANIWDGRWYQIVAENGYPHDLPRGADGAVTQNAWAFLPGYPAVVTVVRVITSASWPHAAIAVSLVAGLGACLVLHRLLVPRLGPGGALFAVALFAFSPVSALFQVAYAESLGMLLLALALWALTARSYLLLIPAVIAFDFTRPGGIAFALVLAGHLALRVARRSRDALRPSELAAGGTALVVAVVAGLAWPVVAGIATGVPTAYTDTELSWRVGYLGPTALEPFAPWLQGVRWWFGEWWHLPVWLGNVVLAALVAGLALFLFTPAARRLGSTLRLWCAAYGLYVLAVFFPQSSTFRILLPLFPLDGALAVPRSPVYRTGMLVASVAGQVAWLAVCWLVVGADWTPP